MDPERWSEDLKWVRTHADKPHEKAFNSHLKKRQAVAADSCLEITERIKGKRQSQWKSFDFSLDIYVLLIADL